MQYISKALVTGGLAILTGPLCPSLQAQDYVDVEAERAAAEASGISSTPAQPSQPSQADPYGAQPAQAYPATSYGSSNALTGSVAPAPVATPAGGQSSGQNLSNLFYQIQQLQQEVRQLNGKVEQQAHELRKLKEQSLERYVDLDKRLGGGAAGDVSPVSTDTGNTGGSPTVVTPPLVAAGGHQPQAAEQPGEGEAYRAAYALVRGQKFDQAVQGFEQFLQDYPGGKYAPNAYYWLGELYLVIEPPNLESSRQSFALLLSQYPDNSKAPDALYKLGKVQFMKGNREKAREYLDRVISEYGSTNSAAVKLSRDFIAENY